MSDTKVAYRSVSQAVLDTWEQARQDDAAAHEAVRKWLATLGMADRAVHVHADIDGAVRVVGVDDDPAAASLPDGWRRHRDGYLVPDKRTKLGRMLTDRMAALKGPAVRVRIQESTGMPTSWFNLDRFVRYTPALQQFGDRVYALAGTHASPVPPVEHWEQVPLSVYYAAKEAHAAATSGSAA
jgi:hypothetical protein